jgi:ketosteroid isomerase-like protein
MAFSGPLEARLEVRELIESYANAVTQRDAAAWADLWDDDAVWSMPGLGTGVTLRTKATIVSTWVELMKQYHGPAENPWAFSFVSVLGEMDLRGELGTVRSYSVEAYADAAGRTVHLKGQYDDEVILRGGRWRFSKREWRLMPLEDHTEMSA